MGRSLENLFMFGSPETRRKEVKCFITAECCMCFLFSKSIIRKYSFPPELRKQWLLNEERSSKGVKYTLSRHFALQWILLFTSYYSLATNYRHQRKNGCPAPSATGNSESFFHPKTLNGKFASENPWNTLQGSPFQETQWLCLTAFISNGSFRYLIETTYRSVDFRWKWCTRSCRYFSEHARVNISI